MTRLVWDQIGERIYEMGVDRGVVYPQVAGAYPSGAAWNGLSNVTLTPSGAEPSPLYANNHKYGNLMSIEEVSGSIEAYTYPDEFGACNGEVELAPGVAIKQQTRVPFGLSYRTLIGNDTEGIKYGYKITLVYGCLASPSEEANPTTNENPEAKTMSWNFTTTPVEVEGYEPTATITINSTTVNAEQLAALEAILYGTAEQEARLPLPEELAEIFVD